MTDNFNIKSINELIIIEEAFHTQLEHLGIIILIIKFFFVDIIIII